MIDGLTLTFAYMQEGKQLGYWPGFVVAGILLFAFLEETETHSNGMLVLSNYGRNYHLSPEVQYLW